MFLGITVKMEYFKSDDLRFFLNIRKKLHHSFLQQFIEPIGGYNGKFQKISIFLARFGLCVA